MRVSWQTLHGADLHDNRREQDGEHRGEDEDQQREEQLDRCQGGLFFCGESLFLSQRLCLCMENRAQRSSQF